MTGSTSAGSRLLTHTDLDGVGCAVLFAGPGEGGAEYQLIDNGDIDARIVLALAGPVESGLLVTDHGMRESTADEVDAFVGSGGRFTLLDHHRSSAHLAARTWATVDESRSAAGLLFDHLGRPARYADFAGLVEDHDLWRHRDERSARLAALVGLLGHERFIARFTANPAVGFTEAETHLLDYEEARRLGYLERKLEQAWVLRVGEVAWAFCYSEQYQSDLAELLMNRLGVEATAIVNPARRTVSLRGRGVDVAPLAERQGGGGHARAAAFSFRGGPLEDHFTGFESALAEALLQLPAAAAIEGEKEP